MTITRPLSIHLLALKKLWKEAFEDTDAFLDIFFKTAFSPDRCRCVMDNGVPIAALYWFDCSIGSQKIAYVYAVATAKSYRSRGFGHQLMADTHAHLRSLGYDMVLLVPGSDSLFQYYENMGYQTCCQINEFRCFASDVAQPLNLRKIEKDEYARLRRDFLPDNSVLQEGENLDFLECFTHFYTGDSFLLAASTNGNHLIARELLGNTSIAPYIVHSLGCTEGTFRTPGNEKAFAMYFPLTEKHLVPAYFGFAFD